MKKLFLIFFVGISIAGCAQHKKNTKQKKQSKVKNAPASKAKAPDTTRLDTLKESPTEILRTKADSVVWYARKFKGVKYKYGGEDPKGFDCAGFVCYVFKHYGIKLPRTADAQALLGKEMSRSQIQKGDLVYFRGRDAKNKAIGHVGIVVSANEQSVTFISATVSSGIRIDTIDGLYWKERYVCAKRILVGD